MIQEIKIKNFLSFKDEVTFSFEATKDTFADEYQVVEVAPGVRLLRFAMVYGANASGKSNLLVALDFLQSFCFRQPTISDEGTHAIPFMLDYISKNEPSHFDLVFFVGQTKYAYQLVLDSKQVQLEKLSYYKSVQPTMLFNRITENGKSVISYGAGVKISSVEREKIEVECLKNMSFFAAKERANIVLPDIDAAKDWMKESFMPMISPKTSLFEYAEKEAANNPTLKSHLLEFLKNADFNISNITTKEVKEQIPEKYLKMFLDNDDIPESEKGKLRKDGSFTHFETAFEHVITNGDEEEKFFIPREFESLGTLRTFGIETAIFYALQKGYVLPIDEFESSLHPQLIKFILLNYLKTHSRSQLIITTHYDPLLNEVSKQNDQRIFRKDCVWFTEKLDSGHTDIYSLAEFRGLNRLSSIQKAYNQGTFGAIPQINL